jgi:preprotein translocase subunit SecG
MLTLFILIFAAVGVGLIFFVLLQVPKQAGLSASLGGGSDLFGGRGVEGGLVRITSVLGGLFMLLALLIGILSR